jgi:peptidoglycan/LPS O-acetylase OafA/YrhL
VSDGTGTMRLRELDALRGLAAVAVVIHHYLSGYAAHVGHASSFPWRFDAGQFGVHLFFMISGFVILMTLERTRTAGDFLVSRFARLYPAYWVALAMSAALLVVLPLPGLAVSGAQVAVNATMFQRLLHVPNVDGVYWTLGLELLFYGFMLALWRIGALRRVRLVVALWLGLDLAWAVAVRAAGWPPALAALEPLFLWEYAHLFAAGMLFYRLRQGATGWTWHALILGCFAMQAFQNPAPMPLVAGFFLVFYAVVGQRLGLLGARPLVWLGTISYSVYLLHQILGYEIIHQAYRHGIGPWVSIPAAVVATLLLASAVSTWIERPAVAGIRGAWKRRAEWRRRATALRARAA